MRSLITLALCGLLAVCGCTRQAPVADKGKPYNPFTEPQPVPPQPVPTQPPVAEAPKDDGLSRFDGTYTGTWVTTNRKLDGTMKCVLKNTGGRNWEGTFDGVWQGQYFKYTVKWEGIPSALKGKATIDGANYDWEGQLSENSFKATFGGNRYRGYFDLKK